MLAFSIPWLPMHDASFLSFFPISWHCWCCVERKLSSPSPSLCWLHQTYDLSIIIHACLCSACFFRSCAFHSFGGWRLLCLLGSFFKIKLGFQTLRSKWKLVVTTVACAGLPGQAKTLWLLLHLADCVSVRTCYFLNPDLFSLFVHTYWNHSAGSSIHTQWFSTLFHY